MNILRPAGGFNITVDGGAQASVQAACAQFPAFQLFWTNIVDRLKFTAHLEGVPAKPGAGDRVFAAAADETRGVPRTLVAFHVLGANVRIRAVVFERQPGMPVVRAA